MKLISQISCGNCGKPHRIHRRLTRGIRYRFTCKRCSATITFGASCVRWAYKPEDLPSLDESSSGSATLSRVARDTVEAAAPAVSAPPPIPEIKEVAVNDTMMDGRPPVHLSPLVRRGVETESESSRVRWLRERRKTAATG